MPLGDTTCVSPVQKDFIVQTRLPIRYHALRVTTVVRMLHHVIRVPLDIAVLMQAFYHNSARQVTIATRHPQLVNLVNQVSNLPFIELYLYMLKFNIISFSIRLKVETKMKTVRLKKST